MEDGAVACQCRSAGKSSSTANAEHAAFELYGLWHYTSITPRLKLQGSFSATRAAPHVAGCTRPAPIVAARPALCAARRTVVSTRASHREDAAAVSRRELATGSAAALVAAVLLPALPAAAAAECSLTPSPNGMQYCDLVEGTGASPVKGALIR